jgi:hypothetical protein
MCFLRGGNGIFKVTKTVLLHCQTQPLLVNKTLETYFCLLSHHQTNLIQYEMYNSVSTKHHLVILWLWYLDCLQYGLQYWFVFFVFKLIISRRSPYLFYLFTADVEVVYFYLITLRHTPESVGLLWTRDRPVAETSTWQHKHCSRQTSMSPVGFEPAISASARP